MLRRALAIGFVLLLASGPLYPQKKKKKKNEEKEEITQVLPLLKDPPQAVIADVARLTFHVTPLSSKGLLSQQTRDALKSVFNANKGGTVVKLRAFVAGSGDLRRVQTLVSEEFTERRQPLPALTVVQVGGLPLEGAQITLEATISDRRVLHENGIALISGQPSTLKDPIGPLQAAIRNIGLDGSRILKVSCFLASLEGLNQTRIAAATAFPKASVNFVQLQRASLDDFSECEAVGALATQPPERATMSGAIQGRYSQAALLKPGRVAISGMQMAFHKEESDVRLAFERLKKALETVNATHRNIVMTHIYALTRNSSEHVRKVRFDYYDAKLPPASTLLLFEGLPSLDATVGMDVWAVVD